MGIEGRINRSIDKGTVVSRAEYMTRISPKEIDPLKHFFVDDNNQLVAIKETHPHSNDETRIRDENGWKIFSNDEDVEIYEKQPDPS